MNEKDRILQMFFDIGRWTKAIEKGVGKDIRKDQLIRLSEERTRLAMADAMRRGRYEISPPHTARIPKDFPRLMFFLYGLIHDPGKPYYE